MINIREILETLAKQRTIFHSEADFQHAFAWELYRRLPNASVRLELPLPLQSKPIHLDVWATQNNMALAIELKYKTRKLSIRIGNEQFSLKDQSAQDLARYDFIKDIQRLEQIAEIRANIIGYAILLTNDGAYWTQPKGQQTIDANFRLEHGRTLQGKLEWGISASDGTKRDREKPLTLRGKYTINWSDYSQLGVTSYEVFRYIAVEVC